MPINNKGEKVVFKEGWRLIFFLKDRTLALVDEQGSRIRLGTDDKVWWVDMTEAACVGLANVLALSHGLDSYCCKEESDSKKLVFIFRNKEKEEKGEENDSSLMQVRKLWGKTP